ncbi:MAG TPA: trypsin-like peptidase domain-containing protein [Acidobacteriota bacterium]|nr:trypsin-like peptidase domain-containing protein [Acidobacteriota bacterium]
MRTSASTIIEMSEFSSRRPDKGSARRHGRIFCIFVCAAIFIQASCRTAHDAGQEKPPLSVIEIARTVTPSVVRLNVDSGNSSRIEAEPAGNISSGTGVIFDKHGHIVTSLHVIRAADGNDNANVRATLPDGRSFDASIAGIDEKLDLCVLKIDADSLVPAVFGDSTTLKPGEDVITIGYAFDFAGPPSVSIGIVSALRRGFSQHGFIIPDAIQTDASIHPGNSGGPLVNRRGEVIGINVAVVAWTRDIGFAISSAVVRPAVESIIRNGSIRRAYLGLVTGDMPVYVPLSDPPIKGIAVDMVIEGSPAQKAGLQADDIITSLAEQKIEKGKDLMPLLYMHKPGDDITVGFYRGGRFRTGTVTLEERPDGNSPVTPKY